MSEPIRKPDENPSRVESILSDTIGLSGYEIEAPRSRIEILLLELEELIKEGGGGGESSNYGTSLLIEMDSNFVMSASLLNKDGEVLGEVQTIDLPLESVVVNGSYDSINKQVVLTLQNGSDVRFSVADLVDGLQTEITSQNPLNADLVSDSNSTHKFTTASDISKLAGIEAQANKTTVDDALSGSSTNPVQNKVLKTVLDSKADASTTYTKTEVDTALSGKQNAIDSSHKLLADLVDDTSATNKFATAAELEQIETNKNNILLVEQMNGTKNKLNNSATSYTANNVTFNVKSDKTVEITTSQAATSTTYLLLYGDTLTYLPNIFKNMHLLGAPQMVGEQTYFFRVVYSNNASSQIWYDDLTAVGDYIIKNYDYIKIIIVCAQGCNIGATPIVFKPMIIDDSSYNAGFTDYQPYAMSNAELTSNISKDEDALVDLVDSGSKNLIPMTRDGIKAANPAYTWNGYTATVDGLSFTVNEDLSVTISGTTSTNSYGFVLVSRSEGVSFLPNGDYVLSGGYSGTYGAVLQVGVNRTSGGSGVRYATYIGTPVEFTVSDASNANGVWIDIRNDSPGLQINATVKPMICEKSLYDISSSYQPYAMSNAELTVKEQANENNILKKQDKPTASGTRYNTTDAYAYYVTLAIPANRVCKVSAALNFSNSQPRGIAISQSNDSSTFDTIVNLIGQKVETASAVPQLITEGYCSFNTEKTLYIWAKSASAASNSVFASVEYLS